jgi:hypothetical protein
MSGQGVTSRNPHHEYMFSGPPRIADIGERDWHVAEVPRRDIRLFLGILPLLVLPLVAPRLEQKGRHNKRGGISQMGFELLEQ